MAAVIERNQAASYNSGANVSDNESDGESDESGGANKEGMSDTEFFRRIGQGPLPPPPVTPPQKKRELFDPRSPVVVESSSRARKNCL